jgi:hypothetical protein
LTKQPPSKRLARYMPRRRENLHPAMVALIGRVFEWRYTGEARWRLDRKHAAEIPADADGLWAPDEDLVEPS